MSTPDHVDFDGLIDELAQRHAAAFTREDVAGIVAAARAEIEPGSHHPEFLAVLVAKRARDLLAERAQQEGRADHEVLDLLFVCEHNSARSQMAAAFAEHLGAPYVRARSAGPRPASEVNPLVGRALAERGVAFAAPFPAALTDDALHAADVLVEIGTSLPAAAGRRQVRWDIEDPHGASIDGVRLARDAVEAHVQDLLTDLGLPVASA